MDKTEHPGSRLKAAREKAGWSQIEAAAHVDTERSTYRTWESIPHRLRRTKRAHLEAVLSLCQAWQIEPKDIWGEESAPSLVSEMRAPYPRPRRAIVTKPLAAILLELLESPTAPEEQKRAARTAILDAFPETY